MDELANSDIDVLFLTFDDIENISELPNGVIFNDALAESILSFSKNHQDIILSEFEILLIHCHGGVSRSAAVGAALSFIFCDDDCKIFNDPKLSPNRLVYDKLIEVSSISQSKDEIDKKFQRNLELWSAENLS